MTAENTIKKQKGFKLSEQGQSILAALASQMAISEKAVLEVILRRVAKEEGIGQD